MQEAERGRRGPTCALVSPAARRPEVWARGAGRKGRGGAATSLAAGNYRQPRVSRHGALDPRTAFWDAFSAPVDQASSGTGSPRAWAASALLIAAVGARDRRSVISVGARRTRSAAVAVAAAAAAAPAQRTEGIVRPAFDP